MVASAGASLRAIARPVPRQRHAAGAGEVGPLHQHRRVGERRAEPEPGEPHVPEVTHEPLEGRPGDGKGDPQRDGGRNQPQPDDEPEHRRGQEAEHGDGGEIAERGERREVPQRDDHPVQHHPIGRDAVPPPPAKRAPRIRVAGGLPHEHDGRSDGDETEQRQPEGRVTRAEQQGSQRDQPHSNTSRPSSADR